MDKKYLVSAKDQLNNARYSLIMTVRALKQTGVNFEKIIKEIKETIGDISIAIEEIEDYLAS